MSAAPSNSSSLETRLCCLLIVPQEHDAPSELVRALARRDLCVEQVTPDQWTNRQRGPAPSFLIIVEPVLHGGLESLVAGAALRWPQLRMWRFSMAEDPPLRPYAPVAARSPQIHVRASPPPYERVPLSVQEMSCLLGEDAPPEYGDQTALIERLLDGPLEGFAEAAVAALRRQLGTHNLEMRPADSPSGMRVEHRGHVFGRLETRGVEPAILAAGAGSLARWLALAERMRELHESSQRDPLTGLWNRRYFEQALTQRLQEARRHQSPVTLMLYDIDNFKTYNDRCGHRAGDEILRETARLMLGAVRRQDIVARIGGDEFAVVFWDAEPPRRPGSTHPHTVRAAAERFQRAVHEHGLSRLGQEAPERLTVSAGLASFPQDGQTVDELFDRADRMLMQGKAQGKNVLTFGAGVREARVGRPS